MPRRRAGTPRAARWGCTLVNWTCGRWEVHGKKGKNKKNKNKLIVFISDDDRLWVSSKLAETRVWELSNIARNQEEFFFSHYKCKEETSPKSWSIFGNPHKKYVGGYGYFPCVAQNKRIKLPVQAVEDENIIQFLSRRIGPVGSPGQGGTSPGPMEIHYELYRHFFWEHHRTQSEFEGHLWLSATLW